MRVIVRAVVGVPERVHFVYKERESIVQEPIEVPLSSIVADVVVSPRVFIGIRS